MYWARRKHNRWERMTDLRSPTDVVGHTVWQLAALKSDTDGRSQWSWNTTFKVVRLENGGCGVVATRDIIAGERILCESPLARWSVDDDSSQAAKVCSFKQLEALLPSDTVASILTLSQDPIHGEEKSLLGTWMTNGLPINYEGRRSREAGVFFSVCRINHSCQPNAHEEWNAELGKETVHALQTIASGEEITICARRRVLALLGARAPVRASAPAWLAPASHSACFALHLLRTPPAAHSACFALHLLRTQCACKRPSCAEDLDCTRARLPLPTRPRHNRLLRTSCFASACFVSARPRRRIHVGASERRLSRANGRDARRAAGAPPGALRLLLLLRPLPS